MACLHLKRCSICSANQSETNSLGRVIHYFEEQETPNNDLECLKYDVWDVKNHVEALHDTVTDLMEETGRLKDKVRTLKEDVRTLKEDVVGRDRIITSIEHVLDATQRTIVTLKQGPDTRKTTGETLCCFISSISAPERKKRKRNQ
jgi:peptidoglycan hydrolase CwlO-like protein